MAHSGFIPLDYLDRYCEDGSELGGHTSNHYVPDIPLSTGSLGHALPVAVGVALGKRLKSKPGDIYVILSDGECDEGRNWEAALLATHLNLTNLIVVIDRNGLQSMGDTESIVRLEPLPEKWISFGWNTSVIDGHSHLEIKEALLKPRNGPHCIIANTIKGKGVSFMENDILWHYRPPNFSEFSLGLTEIQAQK